MIIQHNIASLNAARMLATTTTSQKKSAEKLSSGYKVNRASDNAAGLSISEKMRKQIRGLDRASTNSNDGISLAQTAEGALNEVHDMLHRMTELAIQAANETESEGDRESIQAEIDQILTEIDRVSESTKFNETFLLKGGTGVDKKYLNIHDAGLKGIISNSTDGPDHGTFTMDRLQAADTIMIAGRVYTIGTGKADVQNNIATTGVGGDTVTVNGAITYHIIDLAKDENGDDAKAQQTSYINSKIDANTEMVTIGEIEKYELRNGNEIAKKAEYVTGQIQPTTNSVVIDGDINGKDGTYILYDSGYYAETAGNIANRINSATYNVTIGSNTYKLKDAQGYIATTQNDIANKVAAATSVKYNGTTYTLRQSSIIGGSSGTAITKKSSDIDDAIDNITSFPRTVRVRTSSGDLTSYRVIDDSETEDTSIVPQQVHRDTLKSMLSLSSEDRVQIGSTEYVVRSYNAESVENAVRSIANDTQVDITGTNAGKYLAENTVKSISELRSMVQNESTTPIGTNIKLVGSGGTNQYTVRKYNESMVDRYVNEAYKGQYTDATTRVTVNNGGNSVTYRLRNYDLTSVKSRVAGYGDPEYTDETKTGTLMTVDGEAFTAETTLFRQAICIAYGEDQQTQIDAPGAGLDDLFQDGDTVTYRGKDYRIMVDTDRNGYDDKDDYLVSEGRAYKIIAKELQRASSIGATEDRALVKDKNNNNIIDNVTMAADFLVDPNSENSTVRFEIDRGSRLVAKELLLNIHAGADADMTNKIGIRIQAMSTEGLGLKDLNVVDNRGISATYAIDAIDDAVAIVSAQRSLLGAAQNRMEHTIKNLDNVVENTTDAESRLRDTDMADEMVAFSRDNILAQAGQAMLAQANQSSESVTRLLG